MKTPVHLNALRAFEASARHQSFSLAAEELNVTPAAVGQLVRSLEEVIGFPLFHRSNNRRAALVLTEPALRALPDIRMGFQSLNLGMTLLREGATNGILNVTVSPAFAAKWLLPRIEDFQHKWPDIDVRLETSLKLMDFTAQGMDVGIRYGLGQWEGLKAECLMSEEVFPVCAPSQALSHSAARSPDALALAFEDRRYLYRDFHLRVQRAMAQLDRGWSLRKGDRILLAWGNHPAFCEVLFAALGLGIEVVPFSTKLKQAESEALVGHIAPQVVLFDATVQDWLKNTPDARAVSLSEWQALCLPEPLTRPPVPVNRDDTAVMMFTSGTTGEPKGAIITHNNLLCAIDAYTQKLNLTAADSTILAVPIYHITGLSALLALFISLGASIWLQHRFNAPQVITTLREQNITFLHGSPTIFILLCQAAREQSASHPGDFPALRTIACGAGHLSDGLIKELKTLFPHTAIQPIYGLTETTSPATIFPGDVWGSDKCGSSGQAIPGLAITIRNDRQQPLPAGQIGHIWLKGDVVIREYWQHSERRPSCDAQGWFCTGDLGYLDDEGWLYIKDRSKDMINRGGEKIYSLELENILSTYRGVREVAVIPTPSPVYGEEPVAFIVPDGQHHLTSEEILDWLKVKIARFKLPARIIFTRALPRTHNGKVSKQQLKTRLAESIITLSTEDKK